MVGAFVYLRGRALAGNGVKGRNVVFVTKRRKNARNSSFFWAFLQKNYAYIPPVEADMGLCYDLKNENKNESKEDCKIL